MKQQKPGLLGSLSSTITGMRFPFAARTQGVEDPIDHLVKNLGNEVDTSHFEGSLSSDQANVDSAREPNVAERKRLVDQMHAVITSVTSIFHRPGATVQTIVLDRPLEPLRQISVEQHAAAEDVEPRPAAPKASLFNFLIRFRKISREEVFSDEAAATSADAEHPIVNEKPRLPLRTIFLAGLGVIGAFALGFWFYSSVMHHRARATVKPVIKHVAKLRKVMSSASLKPLAVPLAQTAAASDGDLREPPAADDADAVSEPMPDLRADARIAASMSSQILHLCGLDVVHVIGWNYSNGYLLCYVQSRKRAASTLLQRSANGELTFIGGSNGLMTADELSSMFLVADTTAKRLTTNLRRS